MSIYRIATAIILLAGTVAAADPKVPDDVTWVCPFITKGRLYLYRDGGRLLKGLPPFDLSRVIYVKGGKAICPNAPHDFAEIVTSESGDRELSETEFTKLIIPLFYFIYLYERGQLVDESYFAYRSLGNASSKAAIDKFRKQVAFPSTRFSGKRWVASFYIIAEAASASVVEHHILEGERCPFKLSIVKTEIVETKIGITPLDR